MYLLFMFFCKLELYKIQIKRLFFVCRPGYSDDDAGVAEGHDQDREHPGEGEEVEEVCQLLEYPQRRGGGV